MKLVSQLAAAMLLWIFVACHSNADQLEIKKDIGLSGKTFKPEEDQVPPIAADTAFPNQQPTPAGTTPGTIVPAKENWDKKIIKTAHLSLEVKSYAAFNETMHNNVKQLGGYIAQEEQNQSDYRIENNIVIKVPVELFDKAITLLTPAGEKLMEKRIIAEDVTGEMVDTKSRIETRKRVRDRYLDLLKQAKNMEEMLQVQKEINEEQVSIEAADGRLNYLGHATAFSTINIGFYQVIKTNDINEKEPSYGYRLIESLTLGLHWFAELFISLVALWPLWAFIAALWVFIKRKGWFITKKAGSISEK